jgi:peroxiredoxin Q/BCP
MSTMNKLLKLKTLAVVVVTLLSTPTSQANTNDFTLHSATDSKTFKLADAKGKFVALHFLLKTECPFCLRHTRTYAEKSAGDQRVVHIFLKPDTDAEIKQWAGKIGGESAGLTVYRDPDAQLAQAYGIPDGYKFHGQTVHFPALVLLDVHGKEVYRYVGKNNTDRLAYEKFSEKLQELTAASPH